MGYTENKTSDRTCGTDGTCGSICGTCGSEGGAYAGRNYRVVGAPFIKKDARALVTGKPVFTDDLALKGLPGGKGAQKPLRPCHG